jgi:hypothetical protein
MCRQQETTRIHVKGLNDLAGSSDWIPNAIMHYRRNGRPRCSHCQHIRRFHAGRHGGRGSHEARRDHGRASGEARSTTIPKCIESRNGKLVMYVEPKKALYGTLLQAALLFWKNLSKSLQESIRLLSHEQNDQMGAMHGTMACWRHQGVTLGPKGRRHGPKPVQERIQEGSRSRLPGVKSTSILA